MNNVNESFLSLIGGGEYEEEEIKYQCTCTVNETADGNLIFPDDDDYINEADWEPCIGSGCHDIDNFDPTVGNEVVAIYNYTYSSLYDDPNACVGNACWATPVYISNLTYRDSDGFIPAHSTSGWEGVSALNTVPMENNNHFEVRASWDTQNALINLYGGEYGEAFEVSER